MNILIKILEQRKVDLIKTMNEILTLVKGSEEGLFYSQFKNDLTKNSLYNFDLKDALNYLSNKNRAFLLIINQENMDNYKYKITERGKKILSEGGFINSDIHDFINLTDIL